PDPRVLAAAAMLGRHADLLVVPCNGAHAVAAEIERAAGVPLLNMVDLALAEVGRRRWRTVGVLGLGDPVVYTKPLAAVGRTTLTAGDELRARLNAAIFAVMEGRAGEPEPVATARAAVEALRARGVDGVVLGCTEIPLLLGADAVAADPFLVSPAHLLAEAAVRAATAQ
ncbi:MAG TPA: aspartate/glutamate racemase family protein, partial [Humisphaera sp.]